MSEPAERGARRAPATELSPSPAPGARPVRVTGVERLRDLAALTLVAGGAALYLYAHLGMRRLAARTGYAPHGTWLMPQFDRYWKASRVGLWAVAAGVAVGVWSFLALRARTRGSRS